MDVLRVTTLLSQPGVLNDGGHWDSGWWIVGRIAMLLVFIGLIVLAVWWARRTAVPRERTGLERARDILAERYARGELTGEEYRERLQELNATN